MRRLLQALCLCAAQARLRPRYPLVLRLHLALLPLRLPLRLTCLRLRLGRTCTQLLLQWVTSAAQAQARVRRLQQPLQLPEGALLHLHLALLLREVLRAVVQLAVLLPPPPCRLLCPPQLQRLPLQVEQVERLIL